MSYTPSQVLYGAAYYHEYQPTPRLEQDFEEMKAAGFSVIRIGESVWSTWEPEDGVFDLEWITPVLDAAGRHGIAVILGTPTYAVPPWLQRRYPEINAEIATGKKFGWGMRQEMDVTHAAFRFHAERVVRRILERHAQHPAIVGFQVDNEPGAWVLHNPGVFERFRDHLRHRYGTVEKLNEAWGLTYWSHRLSDWSDLWRPDANALPQYDLAWRLFQADLLTEFIAWQTGIVNEYAGDRFVMTCMSYSRPTVRDDALGELFTVTAGNPYFKAQDALALPDTAVKPQTWWTQGTWALYHSADWMFGTRHEPFLVTEVGAQSIGFSSMNQPGYPGQRRQAAWALISRGAQMIEYWHWHTLHFGPETYWGGVLPHSQRPGRTYREIAAIGQELAGLGDRIVGLRPDAQVGLLYDHASKWSFEKWGPLAAPDGMPVPDSYGPLVEAFSRGAFDAGLQTRVYHASKILDADPAEVARELPVFVVSAYYVADDAVLAWLLDYAAAGGHLVLGPRTGYADTEARARPEIAPGGGLHEAAGAWYDEYTNLEETVPVLAVPGSGLTLAEGAGAREWIESYQVTDGTVVARYDHPFHGDYAAVTTREHGAGRVSAVGCLPNPQLASSVLSWAAGSAGSADSAGSLENVWTPDAPSVRVHSAVNGRGERLWVVQNWSWESASVVVPLAAENLHTGDRVTEGDTLTLGPWDVVVLVTPA
ncbi:beta-galactosidase [Kineosporia sp. J2-2]|uniref:beta-galactosidase n=1 Tax=Kineosporia corallincola TaxID=2835133 RepID=A0ABS5TQ03_9ACTN|nr:beta-galactosidase [Kineosporia corallincola]MBT0773190.1 beta-galactosidase [Kineosporia corallincola]